MSRNQQGVLEDLLDLIAMLPWWAGVALAVVSYAVLHHLSAPTPVTAIQSGQIGDFVVRTYGAALAHLGQYLLPLICLFGAGVSFWRQRRRRTLIADVAQAKSASALDGMSWREFEMLVGEAFRLQGYGVAETGGGGPDGGIDLVLTKGREKFLVQCKQWKSHRVGVDVVRELYGVMAAKGATGGFVVTSGRFTDDAKAFAEGRNVQLVDGPRLLGLIQQARQSLSSNTSGAGKDSPIPTAAMEPLCPVCGSAMVKRTARKGDNAGGQFWGCSKYEPRGGCRGTRPL